MGIEYTYMYTHVMKAISWIVIVIGTYAAGLYAYTSYIIICYTHLLYIRQPRSV